MRLHSSIFPLVYSIVINCHLPSNLPLMGALSQLLIPSIKSMNNNICFICWLGWQLKLLFIARFDNSLFADNQHSTIIISKYVAAIHSSGYSETPSFQLLWSISYFKQRVDFLTKTKPANAFIWYLFQDYISWSIWLTIFYPVSDTFTFT